MDVEAKTPPTWFDTCKAQIPTTKWFVGASFLVPMAGKYLLEGTQAGQKLVGHVVTYVPSVASKIKDIGIENFQWQAATPLVIMVATYRYGTKALSHVPYVKNYMANENFKNESDQFAFHAVVPAAVATVSTIGIRYAITWFTQSGDKWLPALAKDAKIAAVSALIGSVALISYKALQYARNGENRKLHAEIDALKEQVQTNAEAVAELKEFKLNVIHQLIDYVNTKLFGSNDPDAEKEGFLNTHIKPLQERLQNLQETVKLIEVVVAPDNEEEEGGLDEAEKKDIDITEIKQLFEDVEQLRQLCTKDALRKLIGEEFATLIVPINDEIGHLSKLLENPSTTTITGDDKTGDGD